MFSPIRATFPAHLIFVVRMGVISLSLALGRTYILRVSENIFLGRKCLLIVLEGSALQRGPSPNVRYIRMIE
jgi:hypothetical protein